MLLKIILRRKNILAAFVRKLFRRVFLLNQISHCYLGLTEACQTTSLWIVSKRTYGHSNQPSGNGRACYARLSLIIWLAKPFITFGILARLWICYDRLPSFPPSFLGQSVGSNCLSWSWDALIDHFGTKIILLDIL